MKNPVFIRPVALNQTGFHLPGSVEAGWSSSSRIRKGRPVFIFPDALRQTGFHLPRCCINRVLI
jgi:hypothetical protein